MYDRTRHRFNSSYVIEGKLNQERVTNKKSFSHEKQTGPALLFRFRDAYGVSVLVLAIATLDSPPIRHYHHHHHEAEILLLRFLPGTGSD